MNTKRSLAAAAALLLALALSTTACGSGDSEAQAAAAHQAIDFRLASLDGGELGPGDFAGEIVLVEFWATWCGPCHVQASILAKLYSEFKDRGVEFLAVSVGESTEVVEAFVEDSPFPYPVLLDPNDELSVQMGIVGLPTVMVLDREREIVYFSSGVADEATVRRALDEAGA